MMYPARKIFSVKLSADEREKLQSYRQIYGLKSEADAVRMLIEEAAARPVESAEQDARA